MLCFRNQVEKLTGERTKLLEELEKTTVSVVTLQTLNDRLDRLATEKPEIFDGIYEDKSAQLQRLISIVDTQLEQIKALNTECNTVKQQLVEKDTELRANQIETEQVREELNELKKPIDSRQIEIQTEEEYVEDIFFIFRSKSLLTLVSTLWKHHCNNNLNN